MIARDVEILDLAPHSWRNLGAIQEAFVEQGREAWVFYDGISVLNCVDSSGKSYQLGQEFVRDPEAMAASLFERHPELISVSIIELTALRQASLQYQNSFRETEDSDEYLAELEDISEKIPGMRRYYKNGRRHPRLSEILAWAASKLPPDICVLIGVFNDSAEHHDGQHHEGQTQAREFYDKESSREGAEFFSLALVIRGGKVRVLSSFEHFYQVEPDRCLRREDSDWLFAASEEKYGPTLYLSCSKSAWKSLVTLESAPKAALCKLSSGLSVDDPWKAAWLSRLLLPK